MLMTQKHADVAEQLAERAGHGMCGEDFAETQDTAEMFIAAYGEPDRDETVDGVRCLAWDRVRRAGQRPATIVVVDFTEFRAAAVL